MVAVGMGEEQQVELAERRLSGLHQVQRPLGRVRVAPGIADQAVDEDGLGAGLDEEPVRPDVADDRGRFGIHRRRGHDLVPAGLEAIDHRRRRLGALVLQERGDGRISQIHGDVQRHHSIAVGRTGIGALGEQGGHDLLQPLLNGQVEGRRSIAGLDPDIGTPADLFEGLGREAAAEVAEEDGPSVRCGPRGIGAAREQVLDHPDVALDRRGVEERRTVGAFDVEGNELHHRVDHGPPVPKDGIVERRPVLAVLRGRVRAVLEQKLDDGRMPLPRGVMEGGPAVGVLILDDGAFGHEELDDPPEPRVGGVEEGGLAARVAGLERRAGFEEQADEGQRGLFAAPAAGRLVKGGIALVVLRFDELRVRLEQARHGLDIAGSGRPRRWWPARHVRGRIRESPMMASRDPNARLFMCSLPVQNVKKICAAQALEGRMPGAGTHLHSRTGKYHAIPPSRRQ